MCLRGRFASKSMMKLLLDGVPPGHRCLRPTGDGQSFMWTTFCRPMRELIWIFWLAAAARLFHESLTKF
jgi:hypothetical protein